MVRMTLSAVVRREAVPLPAKNLVRQLWDLSLQCEGRLGEEVSVTLHPFKLVSVEKPLRSVARSLRLLVEPDVRPSSLLLIPFGPRPCLATNVTFSDRAGAFTSPNLLHVRALSRPPPTHTLTACVLFQS